MENSDQKKLFAKITSWLGFICGLLTILVWFFLLHALSPKINVDNDNLISDVNRLNWRKAMFSFAPSVFFDIWTPLVMGLVSILCHFEQFGFDWMSRTYFHFFCWNFVLALWGNIGYSGGIGVIVSAFTLLCTVFSLVCVFIARGTSPKLGLQVRKPKMPTLPNRRT